MCVYIYIYMHMYMFMYMYRYMYYLLNISYIDTSAWIAKRSRMYRDLAAGSRQVARLRLLLTHPGGRGSPSASQCLGPGTDLVRLTTDLTLSI